MENKKCSKCGKLKNKSEFYKRDRKFYIYVSSACKDCERKRQREYKSRMIASGKLTYKKLTESEKRHPDYVIKQQMKRIKEKFKKNKKNFFFCFTELKSYLMQKTNFRNLFIIYYTNGFQKKDKPYLRVLEGRTGEYLQDYVAESKNRRHND